MIEVEPEVTSSSEILSKSTTAPQSPSPKAKGNLDAYVKLVRCDDPSTALEVSSSTADDAMKGRDSDDDVEAMETSVSEDKNDANDIENDDEDISIIEPTSPSSVNVSFSQG